MSTIIMGVALEEAITSNADRRERVDAERKLLRDEFRLLVINAYNANVPGTTIARWARVDKPRVYEIIKEEGIGRAYTTKQ